MALAKSNSPRLYSPRAFKHQVAIQARAVTQAGGEAVESWTDLSNCFVLVEPTSGRKYEWAASQHADVTHLVAGWWREDLAADMRIVWGTRTLYFLEPPRNISEANRQFEVLCREEKQ